MIILVETLPRSTSAQAAASGVAIIILSLASFRGALAGFGLGLLLGVLGGALLLGGQRSQQESISD